MPRDSQSENPLFAVDVIMIDSDKTHRPVAERYRATAAINARDG